MCLREYLKEFVGRKVRVYYNETVSTSTSPWENPQEGRLVVVGDDFVSLDTGDGFEIFFPLSVIIIIWPIDE